MITLTADQNLQQNTEFGCFHGTRVTQRIVHCVGVGEIPAYKTVGRQPGMIASYRDPARLWYIGAIAISSHSESDLRQVILSALQWDPAF